MKKQKKQKQKQKEEKKKKIQIIINVIIIKSGNRQLFFEIEVNIPKATIHRD